MAEENRPPLKDVYRKLITDPETNPVFKKYSYNDFRTRMLSNPEASGEVADFLIEQGVIKDREEWKHDWLTPSIEQEAPKRQPQQPVQVPTLLQPSQPQSLTAVTGQQAVTPMEKPYEPFQFQNQAEIDQAAKSPVFLANKPAMAVLKDREQMQEANPLMPGKNEYNRETIYDPLAEKEIGEYANREIADAVRGQRQAASNGLIFSTKEAEQDFQTLSPEQQQAAIRGGSGGRLSREADEKKKTLRQKLADSFNSVKSYGADLVKSAKRGWEQGNAIQTAKLTDLATGNAEGIDFDAMAKANKVVRDMGATDTELDFAQSDGIWDDISDWMKMVLPVAIESTATLASSGLEEIGTGAATGAAIGSVVPGAGTMAGAATGAMGGVSTAGYNMELYASILDGLDEKGVDVTNPAALKKAFSDKELIGPILKRANTRAAIIGVVDLVGGEMIGHTGRMLKNAEKAGKMSKGMGRLIRGVERTRGLDEAITGSAGELAAQVGSGQEVNWQDVGLEGAGGAPIVALQGALSKASQPAQPPPQPPTQLGGITTKNITNPQSAENDVKRDEKFSKIEDFLGVNSNNFNLQSGKNGEGKSYVGLAKGLAVMNETNVEFNDEENKAQNRLDLELEIGKITQKEYSERSKQLEISVLERGLNEYKSAQTKNEIIVGDVITLANGKNASVDQIRPDGTMLVTPFASVRMDANGRPQTENEKSVVIDSQGNIVTNGQPPITPNEPVVANQGTENLTPTDQGVSGGTVDAEETAVDDAEWNEFVDKGTIDPLRLQGIIEDIKDGVDMSQMDKRYQAIVQAAMPQVNEILTAETNDNTNTETSVPLVDEGVGNRTGSEDVVTVPAPTQTNPAQQEVAPAAAEVADIERRRNEELDEYKGRRANYFVKINPDGRNQELTENQVNDIEEIIQAAIDNGNVTPEKLWRMIRNEGYVYSVDGTAETTLAYLKNRLNGKTKTKPNGTLLDDTKAKYDAELTALQSNQTNDQTNQERVRGPLGEGQTPVQAEPNAGTGPSPTEAGGSVQAPEKEVSTEPTTQAGNREAHNNLISKIQDYNAAASNRKGNALSEITKAASKLGYSVGQKGKGKIQVFDSESKPVKRIPTRKAANIQVTDDQLTVAKKLIDAGNLEWNGDIWSPRPNIKIDWADMRKGISDIKAGKTETVAAKKVIQEANRLFENDEITFTVGHGKGFPAGGFSISEAIKADEELNAIDEMELSDAQIESGAKEWDAYWDSLTEQEKKDYENAKAEFDSGTESKGNDENQGPSSNQEVEVKSSSVEKSGQQKTTNVNLQNEKSELRSEQTGNGRGSDQGRVIAPLEGAPNVQGATGPDPQLVAVAEKYAKDNGIDLKRQAEYVKVDEDRGKRLAQAYEDMKHDPQNPKVKEGFQNLIKQTKAQYQALVDAGYEFTFFDRATDPYDKNPYNAMRDLRNNKKMAVYGTYDGYGTEGVTKAEIENNPMLEDTGLRWKDQNGVEHPVLANDLFRAVHDAFGHGLEGAGFRARGEENAWQAHVRLFTGSAIGAITSETRGQNSWLNYGPYGEQNRNANVDDTVFAEQKTGLMPEWTWTEGKAGDMGASPFTSFTQKGETGRIAREALKKEVGPEAYKQMQQLHKNAEAVIRGMPSVFEVVCP